MSSYITLPISNTRWSNLQVRRQCCSSTALLHACHHLWVSVGRMSLRYKLNQYLRCSRAVLSTAAIRVAGNYKGTGTTALAKCGPRCMYLATASMASVQKRRLRHISGPCRPLWPASEGLQLRRAFQRSGPHFQSLRAGLWLQGDSFSAGWLWAWRPRLIQ